MSQRDFESPARAFDVACITFRLTQQTEVGARAFETRRRTPKVGRDEMCPCGSGKKYKRCCVGAGVNRIRQSERHGGLLERNASVVGVARNREVVHSTTFIECSDVGDHNRVAAAMKSHQKIQEASPFPYEVLTASELSQRLKVKESWIVDHFRFSGSASIVATYGVRQSLTHGSTVAAVPQERVRRWAAGDDVGLIRDVPS